MFSKLIVSGCSFGTPMNLLDSNLSWPSLLKKQLDCNLVNYSKAAMGNEHIFNTIFDHFILYPEDKQNSLVICSLTFVNRIEFFDCREKKVFTTSTNNELNKEFTNNFLLNYYDSNYYYKKFLRNLLLLQNYFESNKINYLFFNAIPPTYNEKILKDDFIKNILENINYKKYPWFFKKTINDIISSNPLPCGHPNEKGHKLIAEILYKKIIEIYADI